MAPVTPAKFSGIASSIKIDGTDLHTFGLIVNSVSNPTPSPRKSTIEIPGLDGDFDYTKYYGTRTMVLSCSIIADTHAQLMTNIDELKSFLRLRENNSSLQLIFQNQLTRFWTVKYDGGINIQTNTLWNTSRTAQCTIQFKCIKPYAEKTTVTTEQINLGIFNPKKITYVGTMATPLNIEATPDIRENLIEKAYGNFSEDATLWTWKDNFTLSNDTTNKLYGTNCIKMVAVASASANTGRFPETPLLSLMSLSKYYVAGCYFAGTGSIPASIRFNFVIEGVSHEGNPALGRFVFVKISPTDLIGATIAFPLISSSTALTAGDTIYIDGMFCYEITAAEYADANFIPPPYISDPSGDDMIPLVNPTFKLCNGLNLFPYGKGSDSTGWTPNDANSLISVISDSEVPGSKCFGLFSNADSQIWSDFIYVKGFNNTPFHIIFDWFLKSTTSGITVTLYYYTENKVVFWTSLLLDASTLSTAWVTNQYANILYSQVAYMRINIRIIIGQLNLKNIQLTFPTLLANPYNSYVDYQSNQLSNVRSIDSSDVLTLDSQNLTSQFYDKSAMTIINNLSAVTGTKLILIPGENNLYITDARNGSATPHTASCGAVKATISYRERYL